MNCSTSMKGIYMSVVIEPVHTNDVPALFALLEQSDLPQEGLHDHVATTLVAREDQIIVGSAALEIYGKAALLRSVAVADHLRGQGLGQHLTNAALNLARQQGVTQVYLLTETAALFSPRFGFHPLPRSEVSPAIHASYEWTAACPVTAQAMVANVGSDV